MIFADSQPANQGADQPPPGTVDPGPPGTPQPPNPALPASLRPRPRPALFISNINSPRDPTAWGTGWWANDAATVSPGIDSGPDMPSVPEAYSTLASTSSQLAKWSSPDVADPAKRVGAAAFSFAPILDLLSGGSYSKGFNAGSLAALKRRQQQMLLDAEEMRQKHANILMDFGQVYNEYDVIDEKTKEHGIPAEEAKERLMDLAVKYQWPQLEELIAAHGIEAGRQFIKNQDALYRDAMSAATTLKKASGAEEDAETAKEWGIDPGVANTGGISGGTSPFARTAEAAGEAPSAPDTGPAAAPSSDFDTDFGKKMHLSPQQMRAVQEQVDTGKPSAGLVNLEKKKDNPNRDRVLGQIGTGVDTVNSMIDKIAADPNMSYDDKMAEIAKINSGVAGHIRGLLDLSLDPKEPTVANRGVMARRADAIAKSKGSPGPYNQGNFAKAQRFTDINSPENKVITKTNDLVQNWMTLLRSLKAIGENKTIPEEQIKAWLADHFTGDAEYDTIYSQIRNIATQINSIQTLTGTPRVTLIHDIVANLQKTASPRSIRAQLLPDLQDAYAILNSYQDQWEKLGQKNLIPGISSNNFKNYNAIVRMNPFTGEVPEDSSLELKAVGSDPSKASTRLKGGQRLPPLTREDIREMKSRIALWEHSNDPALRAKAQDYRERIGPVMNIDRYIPGVYDDAPQR